ncbi:MAG: hypothetical protein HYR83_07390 [Planctomycetes bacterium]|nr:hypothetical protein [Planctomycetota bacterium]
MKKPGRRAQRHLAGREVTIARESIERRWQSRMIETPHFAEMVTAKNYDREPFHRWLYFKQGYSPPLVRAFLDENRPRGGRWPGPILDPFSGSGTCVIESGRRSVPAIGIEAIPSLAFLTNCTFERDLPPLSTLVSSVLENESEPKTSGVGWAVPTEIAAQLEHPLHRAALMLAVSRQYTTAGKFNRGAKPLQSLFADVLATMNEDLRTPMPQANICRVGDARNLSGIADQSIGGIITSPPYLSRHNYQQITKPYETMYRFWYDQDPEPGPAPSTQLPAHARARTATAISNQIPLGYNVLQPCLEEIAISLDATGQKIWINIVREYFQDMRRVLMECRRMLAESARLWVVIGGARLGDVYVPADLMLAELAENCSFRVRAIRVARDLVTPRRKFGAAGHIAPRESIVIAEARR